MIYPSPAKDKVYVLIYLSQSKEIDIEIFSMNGKKVQHSRNVYPMGKHEIQLDINSLIAGNYLVKITAGDQYEVHNIVVN